ncbi:MAG: hypothetical protein ACREMA_07105, partial [Longimicrobiales bacterium]
MRVDRLCTGRYYRALARLSVLVIAGCATQASPAQPGPGAIDPAVEARALAATQLRSRMRVVFDWSLQDRDARFSGEGVTRLEPPYRARLDLFGPRGEGYLSAALVDFELRMPPGADTNVLPPPALLWSVLGVFRTPQGAQLASAKGDSAASELVYRVGNQSWTFKLNGSRLLYA